MQLQTEMPRESPGDYIRQVDGHLVVEPGRVNGADVEAIYRELAVFCIEKQIRRVLVKPCDGDPAEERALRVALSTMVLAGLPSEFKIALLAESGRIEARYRTTARDLCAAGVDAKIFETPDSATRWLQNKL